MIGFEINGGRAEQVVLRVVTFCRIQRLGFHMRGPQSTTLATFYVDEPVFGRDKVVQRIRDLAKQMGCNVEELPC